MAPAPEIEVDPSLECDKAKLFKSTCCGLREGLVCELCKRRAPPEIQRLLERAAAVCRRRFVGPLDEQLNLVRSSSSMSTLRR